jgi:hypothetical protein
MVGNPPCGAPMECDHRFEPLEHVANFREWATTQSSQG